MLEYQNTQNDICSTKSASTVLVDALFVEKSASTFLVDALFGKYCCLCWHMKQIPMKQIPMSALSFNGDAFLGATIKEEASQKQY